MNVLIVTNNPHLPQQYGGSEVSINDLALEFKDFGIDVRVLCGLNNKGLVYYRNRFMARITGNAFPADSKLGYIAYRGWSAAGAISKGVANLIKKYKADLIIVQGAGVIKLARELVVFNVPIIVSIVDVEDPNINGDAPVAENIVYRANSNFTAGRVFKKYGITCKVIPPLIRLKKYLTKTVEKYVTFVNPHPYKGCDLVLALARRNSHIPFIIQEAWPLTADYKKRLMSAISGIPNIQYREPVVDMKSLYAVTKILLVPSQYEEAWGRVVNEAQISGIPVIASNRGGLPEAVGDGGLVIEYDAPVEIWSEALNSFWSDQELYRDYSTKASNRLKSGELSGEFLVKSYLSAYESIRSRCSGK